METLSFLAVAAAVIPLTLLLAVIGWGIKRVGLLAWRRWKSNHGDIAYYGPTKDFLPITSSVRPAVFRAQSLACRILSTTPDTLEFGSHKTVQVIGGATGHRYSIQPSYFFPILDHTDHVRLCGRPFNSYHLPLADTILAQALYLKCPETERAFLALCNRAHFTYPHH